MKIAITGGTGFLGSALVEELAADHEIRAVDLKAGSRVERGDVLDPGDMEKLCRGMEAVIHLAGARWDEGLSMAENETRVLDTRLKGTYNLLKAAGEAGVGRVIQVSDLCVFSGYGEEIIVSEDFAPLPDTSAWQQSVYLSELIGREFARLHPGLVLTLRLGRIVDARRLPRDARFEWAWLDVRDAVGAIRRGLEIDRYDWLPHWGLYDLAADVPGSRFSLLKIRNSRFAFAPQEDFAAWREEGEV